MSCGAALLNGHNMGSEEAYNFVFKGEYIRPPVSPRVHPISLGKVYVVIFFYPSNHTSLFSINLAVSKNRINKYAP